MFDGNFGSALILLSGLPGSGKTTFASALAAHIQEVSSSLARVSIIESDAIRRSIARVPSYAAAESARVFARAEKRAATVLQAGAVAIVDATNLTARDRSRFVEIATNRLIPVIPVRVVAPESVILERLSRPRSGHSQAGPEVYNLMRDRPEPFEVPSVVVDTRYDPAPALALIVHLVQRQSMHVTSATGQT